MEKKIKIGINKLSTDFIPEFNSKSNPKNRNRTQFAHRGTRKSLALNGTNKIEVNTTNQNGQPKDNKEIPSKCPMCEKKRKHEVDTDETVDTVEEKPEKETKETKETKKAKRRKNHSVCAICMNEIDEGIFIGLDCSHVYHEKCMQAWLSKYKLKSYPLCPTCREIVSTNNSVRRKIKSTDLED